MNLNLLTPEEEITVAAYRAASEAIDIAHSLKGSNDSATLCAWDATSLMGRASCVGDFKNVIERCLKSVAHSQGVFSKYYAHIKDLQASI